VRLLKQSSPQCLLYAFAMLLDADPDELIQEIGHDGLEVWWDVVGNSRLRGFHPQELIDCAVARDIPIMTIEVLPCHQNPEGGPPKLVQSPDLCCERLQVYLGLYSGVLTNTTHAVAWDHKESKIYDPNGRIIDYQDFPMNYFFARVN